MKIILINNEIIFLMGYRFCGDVKILLLYSRMIMEDINLIDQLDKQVDTLIPQSVFMQ